MWFVLYYLLAIAVIIAHYTGWLARHNLEWFVWVVAATVFPAVLYL